ncbi:MAG: T9SS type A sorting domain-containing protein [Fibrobacteres bacterium]|nr:T9SS type A sorting domain-containing protein [Fibrobacterota bacterium]
MKKIGVMTLIAAISAAAALSPITTSKNGDSVIISFSVTGCTDVEVSVVNSDGKVLRHIAAGVLAGENSPPAPLQPSLSQRLAWDGKDDAGNVANPPYTIRVRSGVKPVLSHFINFAPQFLANGLGYSYVLTNFPSTIKKTDGTDSIVATRRWNRIIDTAKYLNPQETYMDVGNPMFHYKKNAIAPTYEDRIPFNLDVSDATDEVWVRGFNINGTGATSNTAVFRYDGNTGNYIGKTVFTNLFTIGTFSGKPGWSEPVFSYDGEYVFWADNSNNALFRFTKTGVPAPWPQTGSHGVRWSDAIQSGDLQNLAHVPGPDGSHYVLSYKATLTPVNNLSGFKVIRVKDGVADSIPALDSLELPVSGGMRVDANGKLYLAAAIRPKGSYLPSFINADSLDDSKLPPYFEGIDTTTSDYRIMAKYFTQKKIAHEFYGSILKFDGTKGIIQSAGATTADPYTAGTIERDWPVKARGIDWMYYGISHITSHNTRSVGKCCCNQLRFDVDRYGRVIFPNTFQYGFTAIDNNRNVIFALKSRDLPGLANGSIHYISSTDRNLYLSDYYRNRVAVLNWKADEEQSVSPVSAALPINWQKEAVSVNPNPLNPVTRITIPTIFAKSSGFEAVIFNAAGKKIADISKELVTGKGSATWNARGLTSGIYFLTINTGSNSFTKSLILMK